MASADLFGGDVIVLLVMTDGRRACIEQTIPSALAQLDGPISLRVIHDDSGDASYRMWLRKRFGGDGWVILGDGPRSGFGPAYQRIWQWLAKRVSERWVFSTEDDFTFTHHVDLSGMVEAMEAEPRLRQVALRRQPWNPEEIEAGGVVELRPGEFHDATIAGHDMLTHRMFWTTNPSLHRTDLCALGWPEGAHSEGVWSARLFADPKAMCAYWGARGSGEWVHHIGGERIGVGY